MVVPTTPSGIFRFWAERIVTLPEYAVSLVEDFYFLPVTVAYRRMQNASVPKEFRNLGRPLRRVDA